MVDEFKFHSGDRVKLVSVDDVDTSKGLTVGHLGTVTCDGKQIIEVKWDGLTQRCIMGERQLEKLETDAIKWDIDFPPDFGYELEGAKKAQPSCDCETRIVVNFGCNCAAGAAELSRERA